MAAGLGFKTFTTGEVLTADNVNGYLMQGVLVFASAAARDAAITSPQEGQCCYLKDTDAVQTYSGSAWVGFDDSNAIQNSIVDAKGDIVAASGNDTPARLAVGNNGETLVADSSATTGLRYSATPSASNPLINSAYDVWQRGTSIAGQEKYTADRWYKIRGSDVTGQTVSRQVTGDTTNLPSIQYCARVQRDSGNSSTNEMYFFQSMETSTSIPFVGKTVTFSFYARKGSNYSSTSDALKVYLTTGTGTDEAKPYAYTGATNAIDQTATLTATWQRFSYSATLSASATQIGVQLRYTPTGTASTNDYFEVTGTQIDIGSVALPFRRSSVTIQGELAACQRYYYRIGGTGPTERLGFGTSTSTTNAEIIIPAKSSFRVAPTAVDYSSLQTFDGVNVTAITAVALTGNASGKEYAIVSCTVASGLAQFRPVEITATSTSGYIGFSAEL
jgi:hypothetical protein